MGDFNNPYDNNNQQSNNADQQPLDSQQNNPQADDQQPNYQQPQYQQPQYDGQSQYQQNQQYNQQYNQYQQPNYNQYQQSVQRNFNPLALASLICGAVSFLFSCCLAGFTIIISIAGLVLGIMTLTKKPMDSNNDKTMAIIGIILSCVGIISGIIITIFLFAIGGNLGNINY